LDPKYLKNLAAFVNPEMEESFHSNVGYVWLSLFVDLIVYLTALTFEPLMPDPGRFMIA
jgi:hypothetical protein